MGVSTNDDVSGPVSVRAFTKSSGVANLAMYSSGTAEIGRGTSAEFSRASCSAARLASNSRCDGGTGLPSRLAFICAIFSLYEMPA